MKIIRPASTRTIITGYDRHFQLVGEPGSGYAFDCDASGHVNTDELSARGLANLQKCLRGEGVVDLGIREVRGRDRHGMLIRCECGQEFELADSWENECPRCKRHYNGSGQELDPTWYASWDPMIELE